MTTASTLAAGNRPSTTRNDAGQAEGPRPTQAAPWDGNTAETPTVGSDILNAMTVDVEDYFQVSALSGRVSRADWDGMECRVERNTDAVLTMFSDYGVRATFFTLGWVAERHPALIRRIVDAGHELASHGMEHVRVNAQTPEQFRGDIKRARRLLEDTGGCPVIGYRAASFSINQNTPWAFRILAGAGYRYSSSIYPIRHDHYGMPEAPRFAHDRSDGEGDGAALLEIPITTVVVAGRTIPAGGGGYFRLLPGAASRWALRRVHTKDRQNCVFYFHPWEIDPGQPRVHGLTLRTQFRHYTNLQRMERKLRRLLQEFRWDRMDRVFLPGAVPVADPSARGAGGPS